jgi:hypothetical protein
MPEPKVYEFSQHIGALCATRGSDVYKPGAKLNIDPMERLRMINGKIMPSKQSSADWLGSWILMSGT